MHWDGFIVGLPAFMIRFSVCPSQTGIGYAARGVEQLRSLLWSGVLMCDTLREAGCAKNQEALPGASVYHKTDESSPQHRC